MTEDRILELIRQHRDHHRSRTQSLERRGQFIIALIMVLGVALVAHTGGNMSEVWGSLLLGALFIPILFLLMSALLYAGATIFPLDGNDLFHVGRGKRARSWDRWLTNRAFSGRPLKAFRSLLPLLDEEDEGSIADGSGGEAEGESDKVENGAAEDPTEPPLPVITPMMSTDDKRAFQRERLSSFLGATILDGQRLDLSVDPLLRSEAFSFWSAWFVAERSAGLLRRAIGMSMVAMVLSGFAGIQLSEEVVSNQSSNSSRGGGGGMDGGKSGKGGGGMDGGKSGKGGGGMDGGKSGKGGGKSGKGGPPGGTDSSDDLSGGEDAPLDAGEQSL